MATKKTKTKTKRDALLWVYLTKGERTRLHRRARRLGLSASTTARLILMAGLEAPETEMNQTVLEVNRAGNEGT